MSLFFWTSYSKALLTFISAPDILVTIVTWVKISLKCACGQEEVVQLGDVSKGFGRQADGEKVIIINLGYFSA